MKWAAVSAYCSCWLLIVAAVGCEQSVEVLTAPADAGLSGAGGADGRAGAGGRPAAAGSSGACGTCAPGALCVSGVCVGQPELSVIASGGAHSCALFDGSVGCWGDDSEGQLGFPMQDVAELSTKPVQAIAGGDWIAVAAGDRHSCALRAANSSNPGRARLFCWGADDASQTGVVEDGSPNGGTSGGGNSAGAAGANGAAGNGGGTRFVRGRIDDSQDAVDVKCGGDNCCALRSNGALTCWGSNDRGSAGVDRSDGSPVQRPTRVAGSATFLRAFSVGWGHSCAIRSDHSLWCWGRNDTGQLGLNAQDSELHTPTQVTERKDWLRVAAGDGFTCGICGTRQLFCWGDNSVSQLGVPREDLDGETQQTDRPLPVGIGQDWVEVAAGARHVCGIKLNGELQCWGRGEDGQVGTGTLASVPSPTTVATDFGWRGIALGAAHSCGVDSEHSDANPFLCWGKNERGQLGVGDLDRREAPARVQP